MLMAAERFKLVAAIAPPPAVEVGTTHAHALPLQSIVAAVDLLPCLLGHASCC